MSHLCSNSPLKYEIMKKLYSLLLLLLISSSTLLYAQNGRVEGIVLDENKKPLVGATIMVEQSMKGTTTDVDGHYVIQGHPSYSLVFSYLGCESVKMYIGDKKEINVTLHSTSQKIDDVVVVGYGSLRKSDLTGAVASVKKDVFSNSTGGSFMSSLAGKVSGVQVIQNSGVPGGGTTIRIRGSNSMGDSEPLYVIDGAPYDTSSIGGFETDGAAISPLSMINPSDIESMEILKDASATAIYGARASNGVVLITTKMGSEGKAVVSADFNYGISELIPRIDLLDANQFTIIKNEAQVNAGKNKLSTDVLESAKRGLLRSYDWQDILFKRGETYSGNVSVSGGTRAVKYMASINAYTGDGVVPKTDFKRLSGRLNLSASLSESVELGTNFSIASVSTQGLPASTGLGGQNEGTASVIGQALRTNPTLSPSADGVEIYNPEEKTDNDSYTPLMAINAITQENSLFQVGLNAYMNFRFMKYFNLRVSANYNNRTNKAHYYQSRAMPSGYNTNGWARLTDNNGEDISGDYTLSYNRQFRQGDNISLVFGSSLNINNYCMDKLSVKTFPSDDLLWNDLSAGINHEPAENSEVTTRIASWFWRANYSMKGRYVFTFTARVDGSSKFSAGNKYGFFPAGAFAWNVAEERWLRNVHKLSNLKLRLSYGVTGNQNLSPYSSIITMHSQNLNFGGESDVYVGYGFGGDMANSNLKWESTNQMNVGLDVGLFRNRIDFTMDYYNKMTRDLLVFVQTPQFTGYPGSFMNFGKMKNMGYEFGINGRILQKPKLTWESSFNISFNKTQVVKLVQDKFESGQSLWGGYYTQMLIEGEQLGSFYGFERDGILQENEALPYEDDLLVDVDGNPIPGSQKYVDHNGDGKLTDDDRVVLGCAQPDFMFGFNNTFKFYNFDMSIYIDGQYGNDVCNMNRLEGLMFNQQTGLAEVWNRWTPENPSNEWPRVSSENNQTKFRFSDRYLEDGSFIRLQRITLGYTVPPKIAQKVKMKVVRLYASASNIYTLTNYSGYSPDISFGGSNNLMMGHDSGGYPNPFSVSAGVSLTF